MKRLIGPAAILCAAVIAGCSASEPETRARTSAPKQPKDAPLEVFERDFKPSRFDVAVAEIESSSVRYATKAGDSLIAGGTTEAGIVAGFRVQVMFSSSIDEAMKVKSEVSALFPADIVYMLYDSPYYKVRVGDYQERSDAARALKILLDKGYGQSWIVPDRVVRNPLKPPPSQPK